MRDLRVLQSKVLLKVTSVAPLRGFYPPAIVVVGEKLSTASEVTYNGIEADEFLVSSPSRLIVRIPPSQVGRSLTDLRVLTSVQVAKRDAIVTLGLTKPVKLIEGIDRLVQEWLLVFFTTPGTDIFNPTSGGGGLALLGKSSSANDSTNTAALSMAVERTKQQLLKSQAANSRIPPSERLLSSKLASVKFDQPTTTLSATVEISNILGTSAQVAVG